MAVCPAGHQSQTADYCDVCGEAIIDAESSASAISESPVGEQAVGGAAGFPASAAVGGAGGIPASAAVGGSGRNVPAPPGPAGADPAAATICANCGSPRAGRFCEACGFDSALPAPPAPAARSSADPPAGPAAAVGGAQAGSTGSGRDGVTQTGTGVTPGPRQISQAGASGWSVVVRADRAWYTRALSRNGPDAGSVQFPAYFAERRFRLHGPEMMIGKHDEAEGIHPDIDLRVQPEDVGVSRTQAVLRQREDGGWEVVDVGSTNGTVIGDAADPVVEFTPVALADGDEFHIGAWTTITLVSN